MPEVPGDMGAGEHHPGAGGVRPKTLPSGVPDILGPLEIKKDCHVLFP